MSGFGAGLKYLLDTANDIQRRLAAIPPPRLSSEQGQQLARRRWLANDVAKADALEHVKVMRFRSRAAAAREIVAFLMRRTGKTVTVDTAEAWLKAAGWARPSQKG